jgi:TRAP transporter TAXI family solute receptor
MKTFVIKPLLSIMSMRFGVIAIGIVIMVFAGYTPLCAQQKKDKPITKIEIATGTYGASFYVVGTVIAKVLQEELKIPCVASVTEGAGENVRLIDRGSVEAATIPTATMWMAWTGRKPYEKQYQKSRLLAYLYPNPTAFFALTRSNIKNIKQLKGKRVGCGAAPTTWDYITQPQLEAHGIDYNKDIKKVFGGFDALATQLGDGIIDATITSVGGGKFLMPAFKELAFSKPITALEYDKEAIKTMVEKVPYFTAFEIPAGVLPGWEKQTYPTVDLSGPYLVVSEDFPEEVAYSMTRILHRNTERLGKLSQDLSYMVTNPKSVVTWQAKVIPFHPGAVRYWKEVGLWKD